MDPTLLDLLTFSSSDLQGIYLPHDDPLVVTLTITNFSIKRAIMDIGSSSDILFVDAFNRLGISRDRLRPIATSFLGFNRSTKKPLGMKEFLILMGTPQQQDSILVNFVVMEAPSVYNVIIGRPTLNRARVVISIYSRIIKFPIPYGVGSILGDQTIAWYYYINSL